MVTRSSARHCALRNPDECARVHARQTVPEEGCAQGTVNIDQAEKRIIERTQTAESSELLMRERGREGRDRGSQ